MQKVGARTAKGLPLATGFESLVYVKTGVQCQPHMSAARAMSARKSDRVDVPQMNQGSGTRKLH